MRPQPKRIQAQRLKLAPEVSTKYDIRHTMNSFIPKCPCK
jgi:hypothetical protein